MGFEIAPAVLVTGDVGDNRATTERSIDWAALADAEAVVKGDVGLPSMDVQDGLDLAGAGADSISPGTSGAAGAAGGYGSSGLSGDSGEFMDEPQRALMADDTGEGEASVSRTMSSQSVADHDLQSKTGLEDFETGAAGLPEGGLAPSAGVDDQAAVGVEAGTAGGCCDGSYHLSSLLGVCCGVMTSSDTCSALHGSARFFLAVFAKGS